MLLVALAGGGFQGLDRELMAELYLELDRAGAELEAIEREVTGPLDGVGQASTAPGSLRSIRAWLDEAADDVRRRADLIELRDGFIGPVSPEQLLRAASPMTAHQVEAASKRVYDPFRNGWTSRNLPKVSDADLKRALKELYRRGARVGSGSTADVLRVEFADQLRHSPRGHYEKVVNSTRQLERLERGGQLSKGDLRVVHELLRDLRHAKAAADQAAASASRLPQDLLDGFPRAQSQPAAARPPGKGTGLLGGLAGAARGLLGGFFTPFIFPNPCSVKAPVECQPHHPVA